MKTLKLSYEEIKIELIVLGTDDVIATSAAFDGVEDDLTNR